MVARGAALALALLSAGCQCGFDAGKLDDLACTFDIDCRPDQDCVDDTCQQRPCSTIADCGGRAEFGCIDGFCVAGLPDGGLDAGIDAAVRCDDQGDCLDDLDCTDDTCTDGFCTNVPLPGSCAIDGACWVAGDPDPTSVCRICDPVREPRGWTNNDGRVPSDGIECTRDSCVGGEAVFEPDDARCPGEVCSTCAGGCTSAPVLTVECPDVPGATGGAPVPCTVTSEVDLTSDCISCTPLIGMTSLVRDTFQGCHGLSDTGWEGELGGVHCGGPTRLGPDPDRGEDQLVLNHSNSAPERWVDATDFDSVRLCFDVALDDGDLRPLLSVEMNASGSWSEIWNSDVLTGIEMAWTNVCLDLVAADPLAAGNATLGVRFLPSDGAGGRLNGEIYLDNVAVEAWTSRTIAWPGRVFESDFADCALDEWTATGDPVVCPAGMNGPIDAAGAQEGSWTLSRDLDLSSRCDAVRLGLSVRAFSPDANEDVVVRIDRGAGELAVWGIERGPTPEDALLPFEVSVSDVEPAVRFDPSVVLSISTEAEGLGDLMAIDDVWVDGAECLAAADLVSASPAAQQEPGRWTVDVSGTARSTAYLTCAWTDRPETVAFDVVQFCVDAECAPGTDETRSCGECGTETRRCDPRCRWLDWSPCADRPCSCCDPYTGCQSCCC